jgi:phosphonate metabolism-associated iron-containing alcohol dehydrogenase
MSIHTLSAKTELHFGRGALARLPNLLRSLGATHPLVMLGQGAVRKAGHLHRVEKLLGGWQVSYHAGISSNPTINDLAAAVAAIESARPDCVVALGGGSVIDVAKAARVVVGQDQASLENFLGGRLLPVGNFLPCIAIPTTAGTGSEFTAWATIWQPEKRAKASLEGPSLPPQHAIVDPELTVSVPADLTANCGLDTFSQAVEAYWATATQPYSQALSLRAVDLVRRSLPTAVRQPDNLEAREEVSWACTLTGLSFSQTKTTAAHAFSYPLTLRFGIRHGIACALFIPALLVFNAEAGPPAYGPLFAAFDAGSAAEAAEKIRRFYESVGVEPRLSAHGVPRERLEEIAQSALASPRSLNNPRSISPAEALELLEASF